MDRKVRLVSVLVAFLVVLTHGEPVLIERGVTDTERVINEVHENAIQLNEAAEDDLSVKVDPSFSVNPFLVGGGPAAAGAFPAQVAIQIGTTTFCGGSILNVNHILTAAGCVLDVNNHLVPVAQVTVRAGVLVVDQNAPVMAINRIFPHPQYNPWTFENDIAVLRLTNNIVFPQVAVPNMAPAVLNHRIVRDTAVCQVVGWNWQQATPNVPLQVLNVQYSPRTTCNAQHNGMLHDSMACTVLSAAAHGVCAPNRGGGLYCNDYLTGVISFGFGCGANNTYTVYTQVRFYQHWIQQQFTRTDIPVAGPTPAPGVVGGGGGTASSITLSLATILVAIVAALFLK